MVDTVTSMTRRMFVGGAAAFGAVLAFNPRVAFAVTSAEKQAEADNVRNQLIPLQADLERAANDYYCALDNQAAAQAAMEAAQAEIDEANARISVLKERLGSRAREMYRTGPTSYLDFVLGASSFEEFTTNWSLLNNLNENDAAMVQEIESLREELEAARDEYARQEEEYAKQAAIAEEARATAEARVAEANALISQLDAEARELLEQEQAAAAAAAAAEAAAEAERQAAAEAAQQAAAAASSTGGYVAPSPSYYYGGGSAGDNSAVVGYALSKIGCPYVWGAEGPNAFDCSGLVRWAYLQIGMSLPHYTESLYACASNVVPVSEARPGDVLYRYGHVGIAVGYGGVPYVHAPTFGAYVRDTDALSWSNFTAALQF